METKPRRLVSRLGEAFIEKTLFGRRAIIVSLFLLTTLWLGFQAVQIKPDASFEKMIPTFHPYIENFLAHKDELKGLGNAVRVVVENPNGEIYTTDFLDTLKQIHEEVFYIPGVDRTAMLSIWSASVRWTEVTEDGFAGGPVIPDTYDGSGASIEQLRANVLKSGKVGTLVANNFKSAIIYAPLMEFDPDTGEALDYKLFSDRLEKRIRDKYQSDKVVIHITGFAKVVGDLIDGVTQVALFFAIAVVFSLLMLVFYTRCLRSTLIILSCSIMAVVWQLGILHSMGLGLDPYSMLVPFLVFAIGVSHSVQIFNGIVHEVAKGADGLTASRNAFRTLYIPGLTALISDGIGFATLMVIEIGVIQELALTASIGVAVIILTNLILLPILISYSGVSPRAIKKLVDEEEGHSHPFWHFMANFTQRRRAAIVLLVGAGLFVVGFTQSGDLKIGDLDPGAPELRPDSRYNLDNQFITENYSTSTDILVVMVKTTADQCSAYETLDTLDSLQWQLEGVPGVQSTYSLVNFTKIALSGMNEGSLKWNALNRNQQLLNAASVQAPPGSFNSNCSLAPLIVFLNDHKASTLTEVTGEIERFAHENGTEELQFLLAAGSAGIEAATNKVIETAQYKMLAWVYGVVFILCWLSFRSLRTVICILLPLSLTSLLCQTLMAQIGIGVKVATLPVIALGVGIGVDYGIYIYSKMQGYLDQGLGLEEAYFNTLKTTGKAVGFTGITLAIGVGTWTFSPIKFQADMGILLTFMFIWNMVGALTLLPALASFLHPRSKVA
ncbi:MMPL family transporter [Amphritea sp. 2_MG-2023]|uniref:efflux RND transporter permease subunit n=1 Tax=Amphritea sp. 2_MG-2023 TaxID=3062682 RepID=UPI001C073EFA|nr:MULTISPECIES: MMPL family transporter [Amphritea]MBU2964645.1 MMPL family transporter [Amphritea atlantica]MDO6420413.1 MMPL family transporter [Amphritea sp. 2_MG-2023]